MISAVKLLMTWDIQPGREEDYFEFHIRKFVPALEGLGVALSEAWLTVYGEQPRLLAEAVMPDLNAADVEGAMRIIEGTAKNMGIEIVEG